MKLRWISFLINGGAPAPKIPAPRQALSGVTPNLDLAEAIYPPDDPGLATRSTENLLSSSRTQISRLRLHAACEPEKFDLRYLDPIKRLARHVNVLPGSASAAFAGEAGLLRAALEMSFFCFQASDGRIFTGAETVEVRHRLEPRWRYVCFLAGLLYPIGIPMARMVITTRDGRTWPKYQSELSDWMSASSVDRIYVNWPDEARIDSKKLLGPAPYTAAILHTIAGADNLGWLEEGSPEMVKALFALVSGHGAPRIAQEVVSTMWAKVMEREELRRPQAYGRLTIGTHLSPFLVDAMRALVANGTWQPNEGALVADASGVYLLWPEAGEAIIQQGARDGRDGWPSSVASLADVLRQDGIVESTTSNDLGLAEVIDKNGVIRLAYKLKKPGLVLESYEPAQYLADSPKTLAAILDRDPLAKADKKVSAKKGTGKSDAISQLTAAAPESNIGIETTAEPPSEYQSLFDLPGEEEEHPEPEPVALPDLAPPPASAVASVQPKRTTASRSQEDVTVLKESAEVKFSDLVPVEIRQDIKNPLAVELLGKVVKAWRARGTDSTAMRMTDSGAAMSLEFLGTLIRSIPDFVNEMAAAGLVYSPPDRPGLKVHKVAMPEGSKPKDAIIFSRYGCKKLEL